MKLVYCLSIVSSLLIICGGTTWPWPWPIPQATTEEPTTNATTKEPVTNITTGAPYNTTKAPTNITTQASITNTTTAAPYSTTKAPTDSTTHGPNVTTPVPTNATTKAPITNTTRRNTTTGGSGLNLRGKMITVSEYSEVTFYPPHYFKVPPPASRTTTPKNRFDLRYPRVTTQRPTPATRGVSVCLRFMVDDSSVTLFQLDPDYNKRLSFSLNDQRYTLGRDSDYRYVSLKPIAPLWPSAQTQLWTSVCVVLDSHKNVVQVFQGGTMSVRKITPPVIQWSGTPVVKVSGFDGQVTDLEVWDYPLEDSEIFIFMHNYRCTGTVLTWSNIAYQSNGDILMEDTYSLGQSEPHHNSEREEQPIRSKQGRGQRHKYRKLLSGRRQRKRQIF